MASYVADFETTTKEQSIIDGETRVWGYGVCEIGNTDNMEISNNIDDFMVWCMNNENPIVYFHNLKFDSSFILSWLYRNGYEHSDTKKDKSFNTTISSNGQFYVVEVIFKRLNKKYNKVVFYDSLKKLPFKVERIAKTFDLPFRKLKIDYHTYRGLEHVITEHEYEYIKVDIIVIAMALEIQFSQGLKKMTTGSDALSDYKNTIGRKVFERRFPILNLEYDAQIRYAYKGGWTYASNRYRGKDLGNGLVFDVNSLYPSVMMYEILPFDYPLYYKGKYVEDRDYNLYIQELRCTFKLKKNHVPTIQIKGGGLGFIPTEYLENSGDEPIRLHLTNIDLKLFHEQYDVEIHEYVCGYMFKGRCGMFDDYINKWNAVKSTSFGGIRELAKLMLNSLYGKFATNPDITGKVPYYENGKVKFRLGEKEFRDPVYTAMGAFITSYARAITIRTAQANYKRFAYADTDSLHLTGTEKPNIVIHGSKLGAWKLEGRFERARILGAKSYIEEYSSLHSENKGMFRIDEIGENLNNDFKVKQTETGRTYFIHLDVKCAGMPDAVKENVNWNNFQFGFTSEGKLRPNTINGGTILEDTPFTLRER